MVLELKNGKLCFKEQLLLHIKRKNNDEVRSVLINDDAFRASDSTGATLLHFTSQYGNAEVAQYLIDSGVNVNAQDILGRTPLLLAVAWSEKDVSIETITTLLEANADVLKADNTGLNPLQYVVDYKLDNGQIQKKFFDRLKEYCRNDASMIADLLVKAECSIECAILLGNSTITEMMIKAGCDVNAIFPDTNYTALYLAAELMDVENVKVLIKCGADVAPKMGNDYVLPLVGYLTPRARYPRKRNREVMKLLMREYFTAADKAYATMLSVQAILRMGDEEDIRYMLQYDVDFSMRDAHDNGVLHYLADNPNPNVAKPFKGKIGQIDVNMRNGSNCPPLYHAARKRYPSTVQFLLDNGAEVDAKIETGATPLVVVFCAPLECRASKKMEANQRKVVEILLRHGADVQVIFEDDFQDLTTMFDLVVESTKFDLGEPLMARLVFLEKLGKPIVDLIRSRIDGHRKLKNQYDSCKRQLEKMEKTVIHKPIILFNILIKSEEEIVRCHVYNWELLKKLKKLDAANYCSSSYYYDTLRARISSVLQKIKLIQDATKVIFSRVAPQLNGNYLVARYITDYLDYEDIKALNKI